ncbi:uncharacterized protein I206_103292 [Kwoniella pini CBS 10737]|uniref:Uncharacterized protein n=1 Tax=Kwoniella pini CBS 10737 TaxID=1296096 RepID=A0A1B9IAB2_9TREE|nr:uncharacterized protein I206_01702 [Kwoniella pini CBS 10737]OCF52413.1 hypothetical protein I206_01702 [Kwoniella pini CBS 10737]
MSRDPFLPEIIFHIAKILQAQDDVTTLFALTRTTTEIYDILASIFYPKLTITQIYEGSIFWGILPHAIEEDYHDVKSSNLSETESAVDESEQYKSLPYDNLVTIQQPTKEKCSKNPLIPNAKTNSRKLTNLL